MHVCDRLRLNALSGVDDQERAFTGCQRSRYFIGEIDVPRRIEKIETIGSARFRPVIHSDRMCFDGDTAFPLQIHGIEQLILFLALLNRAGAFQQPIGQGGLTMIDVRDDAKIARSLDSHEESHYAGALRAGQFVAALSASPKSECDFRSCLDRKTTRLLSSECYVQNEDE